MALVIPFLPCTVVVLKNSLKCWWVNYPYVSAAKSSYCFEGSASKQLLSANLDITLQWTPSNPEGGLISGGN